MFINFGRYLGPVLLGEVQDSRDGRYEIVVAHTLIRGGFGLRLLLGSDLVLAVRLRLLLIPLSHTVRLELHAMLLRLVIVVVEVLVGLVCDYVILVVYLHRRLWVLLLGIVGVVAPAL